MRGDRVKQLPLEATDEDILAAARGWLDLLAEERYQEAFDYLHHLPEEHLTPTRLAYMIQNYGDLPYTEEERVKWAEFMSQRDKRPLESWLEQFGRRRQTVYKVTPLDQLPPPEEHTNMEVYRIRPVSDAETQDLLSRFPRVSSSDLEPDPNLLARVDYDLPLNGEWSDLTAQFLVYRVDDSLALVLQDLHVL